MTNPRVFITVDTEHSIGGAFRNPDLRPVGNMKRVYGNVNGKSYGIPLIMDIADQYGIKVVFFVEVLNKYVFGENETRAVCEYVLERGHEVQLHLHPHYLNFTEDCPGQLKFKDNLYHYSLDRQTELLCQGRLLLEKYGVVAPVAFRAGNYGFNRDTMTALLQAGFHFDSSYNYTFIKSPQGFDGTVLNDAQEFDGVWEFPITNFFQTLPNRRPKPLDLNGCSSNEMIRTLKWAASTKKLKNITIILHSFSFLEPLDVQYEMVRIRRYVINRFERLCQFLFENRDDYIVSGFNDLKTSDIITGASGPEFLQMPGLVSLHRTAQQLIHRIIKQ